MFHHSIFISTLDTRRKGLPGSSQVDRPQDHEPGLQARMLHAIRVNCWAAASHTSDEQPPRPLTQRSRGPPLLAKMKPKAIILDFDHVLRYITLLLKEDNQVTSVPFPHFCNGAFSFLGPSPSFHSSGL
jgi:hypothetical protein